MKTITLVFALAIIVPASAFAWFASFSSPQLGFPDGTPPETIKKVIDYLNKDLTFIDGNFFNEFTTQKFSGSASKLNDLIQLLHVSRFELKVAFGDLKDDRVTFTLFQNAHPEEATITVNTTKRDFKLSELQFQIPPTKGTVESGAPPNAVPPRR